jgi:hypothetical protein
MPEVGQFYIMGIFTLQVVSDKDMVKLLQKEVSRLEAELRVTESSEIKTLLKQKDAEIQQVALSSY